MSALADNYLSGLGDDGVLTQAAGYDGFVFDVLPGMGKAFTLAEATPGDDGASLNAAPAPFFTGHVPLPGFGDALDVVDLAHGLFATHTSSVDFAVFHDDALSEKQAPGWGSEPASQDSPTTPPLSDVPAADHAWSDAFLALMTEHGGPVMGLHDIIVPPLSFGLLQAPVDLI